MTSFRGFSVSVFAALSVTAALYFVCLGSVPLTDLDEGAFAEASREMLVRGDWVSPWLLDVPRFDKPVLIHWLQMLSFSVFGVTPWAARLPSALAGMVWVAAIGVWAQMIAVQSFPALSSQRVAFGGIMLSGSSIGMIVISRASTADAVLNAFLVLSLVTVWRALYAAVSTRDVLRYSRWTALWVGLGFLTKGPIAVLIPGAAAMCAAASLGKSGWGRLSQMTLHPWSWLVLAAVAGPWYLIQFQAQGYAFIEGFFGTHNLGRFRSTMHGFSYGPWYYPVWISVALLPWTPLAIWALVRLVTSGVWRTNTLWMCWGTFIFVILIFSASATKLPHYGFYGLTGFLVLIILLLEEDAKNHQSKPKILLIQRCFNILLALILMSVSSWWNLLLPFIEDAYYQQVLEIAGKLIRDNVLVVIGLSMIAILMCIPRRTETVLLSGAVISAVLYIGLALPIIHALRDPITNAAKIIREQSLEVVSWRLIAPSLSFAAQRVISPGEPEPGYHVVMHAKDHIALATKLSERFGGSKILEVIWSEGGIQIVRVP